MITRHGRKSADDDDDEETKLNRCLQDAGLFDENMERAEKETLCRIVQESKGYCEGRENKKHVDQFQPSSSGHNEVHSTVQPEHNSSQASAVNVRSQEDENLSLSETHHSPYFQSDKSSMHGAGQGDASQDSESIFPENTQFDNADIRKERPDTKSRSNQRAESITKPNKAPGGLQGKANPVKGGRGRSVPVKYKYDPLPIVGSGKKDSTLTSPPYVQMSQIALSSPRSPSGPHHSPQSPTVPSSLPSDPQSPLLSPQNHPSDTASIQDQPPNSLECSQDLHKSLEEPLKFEDADESQEVVCKKGESDGEPMDVKEDCSQNVDDVGEKKPDLPVAVEDAVEEQSQDENCLTGKFFSHKSPLEHMMKQIQSSSCLPVLGGLGEFRDNKADWMEEARKRVAEHRCIYWKRVMSVHRQWGPPIQDGGYNKQTLFKQAAPKYSKLFANASEKQVGVASTSFRPSRQAKVQARAKIQETDNDIEEWTEPNFVSLRKTNQRPKDVKPQDHLNNQTKVSNLHKSKKPDVVLDVDDNVKDSTSTTEEWISEKIPEKNRCDDSYSEVIPDYSCNVDESPDPYEFPKEDEEEEEYEGKEGWKPAARKTKKNINRGGKGISDDVELETKTLQQSRNPNLPHPNQQQSRKTKLRLQKGAISRPSEHAGNSRSRDNVSEHHDGNTSVQNTVRKESGWINTTHIKTEKNLEISPRSFFPSRGGHSRGTQPIQPRKALRDEGRSSDLPPSPGSVNEMQHDERNEAAAPAVEVVACPICGKGYPKTQIENHASECQEYSSTAEGECLSKLTENGEESDETLETLNKTNSHAQGGSDVVGQKKCKKCNDFPSTSERRCVCSNLAGQKRASSLEEDGGPAKKPTRLLEKKEEI